MNCVCFRSARPRLGWTSGAGRCVGASTRSTVTSSWPSTSSSQPSAHTARISSGENLPTLPTVLHSYGPEVRYRYPIDLISLQIDLHACLQWCGFEDYFRGRYGFCVRWIIIIYISGAWASRATSARCACVLCTSAAMSSSLPGQPSLFIPVRRRYLHTHTTVVR